MIESNFKKLKERFDADMDWISVADAYQLRENYKSSKIPAAIDTYIIQNANTMDQKRMAKMAREYYKNEITKQTLKLEKWENDCLEFEAKIKKGSKAKDLPSKLKKRRNSVANLKKQIEHYGQIEETGSPRIFPNYYAPAFVDEGGKRVARLMRYQLMPALGTELPPFKYNLFNARRDKLMVSKMWKPLFGTKHAIFPFYRFYENVDDGHGGNQVIYFETQEKEIMWSAAIHEEAKIKEGTLRSLAAITDEPPPEVAEAGHDRCPVYLQEKFMDLWLNPEGQSLDTLFSLLDEKTETYFNNFAAA